MKRRFAKPVAAKDAPFSVEAQNPEGLEPLMEDPMPESRDMSQEQKAAFAPPDQVERRVLNSQGDQGRT